MKKFNREERYTVLKFSDIHECSTISRDELDVLIGIEEKLAIHREKNSKSPLTCVVVEDDWPEYEMVWSAIEYRMSRSEEPQSEINLYEEFDALVWTEEWLKAIEKNPLIPTDPGTMVAWFANAIMAGHDHAYRKLELEKEDQ